MISEIKQDLKQLSQSEKAEFFPKFFKTGQGEYGEGDIFIGVTVPDIRKIAKKYFNEILLEEIKELLKDPIHEYRLLALVILTYQFPKASEPKRKEIYEFYLENTKYINNWDLVDLSAKEIVGAFLSDKDRKPLYTLAYSQDLWENRIAIISTFYFIKSGDLKDTFKISEILLTHKHDLIHKAVGWMLREAGKKDEKQLKAFLLKHIKLMPRTMLRYAIEKFPEGERKRYLKL